MMHCTMEDLGALRAGEGSVWARRHIITCAICQAELEALYQRVAKIHHDRHMEVQVCENGVGQNL